MITPKLTQGWGIDAQHQFWVCAVCASPCVCGHFWWVHCSRAAVQKPGVTTMLLVCEWVSGDALKTRESLVPHFLEQALHDPVQEKQQRRQNCTLMA